MNLENRVVLITGATGGLGTFVTQAFLDAGAAVAAVFRPEERTDLRHERFHALPEDLTSARGARAAVDAAIGKWKRIDVLAHLLGGFAGGTTIGETDEAVVERMLDLNYRPAFHIIRAVLPALRTQGAGRILAIGSRTAVEPVAGLAAYSASKAALVSLIRTVALEEKANGITANVVLPGTMDTPGNRSAMPKADPSKWVQPGQVASLLVHLASDEASQVTGAVIPVYGREL